MALYRCDLQGTLQGIEEFQHGFHVTSAGSAADVAADVDSRWSTFLGTAGINTFWNNGVNWAQVNVSELGATPSDPIQTSAQAIIGLTGQSTDSPLPPQCSVCMSVNTSTSGSRARGRMFLPSPDISVLTAAGRLSNAFRTAVIAGLQTVFTGLVTDGHALIVVSAVGGVYTTYSATSIRLGDVVDTQQRRRNSIAEVYSTAAV